MQDWSERRMHDEVAAVDISYVIVQSCNIHHALVSFACQSLSSIFSFPSVMLQDANILFAPARLFLSTKKHKISARLCQVFYREYCLVSINIAPNKSIVIITD